MAHSSAMWAGFGIDSLPLLPAVLAKAWAAPPVLEHPRHFTNMSGASAGMAARAGGWLGLSGSVQSLSSSLSFYVASLSSSVVGLLYMVAGFQDSTSGNCARPLKTQT